MQDQKANPRIIISDLDGTIALIEHRRHWLDKSQHTGMKQSERWRRFFADCVNDQPNYPVIEAIRGFRAIGYEIHIFSGRSDEVRNQTLAWLAKYDVNYDKLKMRDPGDFTADEILKAHWVRQYDRNDILCIFDDRQKVVDMWRQLGMPCFQVAPGDF